MPFELASAGASDGLESSSGMERWFHPGDEVLVVETAEEALTAYRMLLDDPGRAAAMGAQARQRVLDEHTYVHRARQLLRLIDLDHGADLMSYGRVIAIVPAHNEGDAVGAVIDEIRAFDPTFDIVVVDDGSVDSTSSTAARHGAAVITLPFNLGIGGAVQTGFKYALERGYSTAVRLDGDGQHVAADLGKLLDVLMAGTADIVTGSRFAGP